MNEDDADAFFFFMCEWPSRLPLVWRRAFLAGLPITGPVWLIGMLLGAVVFLILIGLIAGARLWNDL